MHERNGIIRWLVLCVAIGTITACAPTPPPPLSTAEPTTGVPATAAFTPATFTPPPSPTPATPAFTPVAATATLQPSSPTPAPPTVTSPPPTTTPSTLTVQLFLVALEDNGQSGRKIGCDDSVVPVQIELPRTTGVLRATLVELLSLQEPFYGESGLYNSLHQSDLQVEDVVIENGKAIIHLTGTLIVGGVCDNPRVEAQIEETALQFSTVSEVAVFVDGVPLEDLLSLEG